MHSVMKLSFIILPSILTSTAANIFQATVNDSEESHSQDSKLLLRDGSFPSDLGSESITSAGTCRNNLEWSISEDGNSFECDDIHFAEERRRVKFCGIEEVRTNCPVTCGLCCEDDPNYLFVNNNGVNTDCEWLVELKWFDRKYFCNTFNNNGMMVRASCAKSCSYCKDYVSLAPSAQPSSMSPTRAPSLDPTPPLTPGPSKTSTSTPSSTATLGPSKTPTYTPSSTTTREPSSFPSRSPNTSPSFMPSSSPSTFPTLISSLNPLTTPTDQRTFKRPNIVMIITDEHNLKTLSCYRDYLLSKYNKEHVDVWGFNQYLYTPNIDSLARDGALFTNFYTASPVCTPSRASFMTGMYPAFTGDAKRNHGELDENLKTFASILRDERGYSTSFMGKWHLDGEIKPVSYFMSFHIWNLSNCACITSLLDQLLEILGMGQSKWKRLWI